MHSAARRANSPTLAATIRAPLLGVGLDTFSTAVDFSPGAALAVPAAAFVGGTVVVIVVSVQVVE